MTTQSIADIRAKLRSFAAERDWDQFHSPKNISMALSVEVAELLEHFQWLTEAESTEVSPEDRDEIELELGDVLIYLIRLADKLDVDLIAAADKKMIINAEKYPVERVKGSAKKFKAAE